MSNLKLESLEIVNCKGINTDPLELKFFELYSNKPNMFVARNGYGKSTITKAFEYTYDKKMMVKDNEDFKLCITFKEIPGNVQHIYTTTSKEDTVSKNFFVKCIHSNFKVNKSSIYGNGTLTVKPINFAIITSKPIDSSYASTNLNKYKKILTSKKNFELLLNNFNFISDMVENYDIFKRIVKNQNTKKILDNVLSLFSNELSKKKFETIYETSDYFKDVYSNKNLKIILNIIENNHNCSYIYESILILIQIIDFVETNSYTKKSFTKMKRYLFQVSFIDQTKEILTMLNVSDYEFNITKKGDTKTINFPAISKLSNGERDIINFIGNLRKFEYDLELSNKKNSILIIDEVFDYLDSNNLLTVLYYFNNFFNKQKSKKRRVFVIIMTHLDPKLFNYFNFKHKVHYLQNFQTRREEDFLKLLVKREEHNVGEDNISKYYMHYIDEDFTFNESSSNKYLNISNTEFRKKLYKNIDDYTSNKKFEPLMLVLGIRILIEEYLYALCIEESLESIFIDTHTIGKKIDLLTSKNIDFNEDIFFLQVLANEELHLKEINPYTSEKYSKMAFILNNNIYPKIINTIRDEINYLYSK